MRKKIQNVPSGWLKIQRKSALGLVAIEFSNLAELRTDIERETEALDLQLRATTDESRQATIIRTSADRVAAIVEAHVLTARHEARELAIESLEDEIDELGLLDDIGIPSASTSRIDSAAARSAGLSFASAWTNAAMASVYAEESPRYLLNAQDYRLRRIMTTETARAYNDEHEKGLADIAETHNEKVWFPLIVRRWDAILDRRTCQVCRDHDGEITPLGIDFSGGDEPGDIHTNCRCISTLVPLPAYYNKEAA